jgi:hypothetical protein
VLPVPQLTYEDALKMKAAIQQVLGRKVDKELMKQEIERQSHNEGSNDWRDRYYEQLDSDARILQSVVDDLGGCSSYADAVIDQTWTPP